MLTTTFRRSVLALFAVLALAASGAAPTALAADNGSGGSGTDDICQTLLNRLKRFHTISKDAKEPKAVRDFYRSQAEIALLRARTLGCGWAAIAAGHGPATVGGATISDAIALP